MESSEREPSYYEVALTHRQVLAGFVILLACLFAAFFSGIWIGQGSAPSREAHVASADSASGAGDAKLDQLTFFGDRNKGGAAAANIANGPSGVKVVGSPAAVPPKIEKAAPPAEPTPAEAESEKLRATLEAEMNAHRDAAAAPTTLPAAGTAAVGARVQRAPTNGATTAATPPVAATTLPANGSKTTTATNAKPPAAPAASAAKGTFWVQVYSTATRAKADEILAKLRKGGYSTKLLVPAAGGKNFRVRVGPYAARDKATTAATKLRQAYRLDTWVTDRP